MSKFNLLQITILLITMLSAFAEAEKLMNSRKLDDQTTPPDLENKCGDCPCDKPCIPPPSPPPPSPPPPPPAETKKPPPSNICPPPPPSPSSQNPPSPPYIYINGPPGSVYPVYPYYSGGRRRFSVGIFPFLISFILLVLAF